jgi:hypothetical protein
MVRAKDVGRSIGMNWGGADYQNCFGTGWDADPGPMPVNQQWKCQANTAKAGRVHHPERDSRTKAPCAMDSSFAPENIGTTIGAGGPHPDGLNPNLRTEYD